MAGPRHSIVRDLPVSTFSQWDRVALVRRALEDLDQGQLRSAAYLCDTMGRDDRITGVLTSRLSGLLGLPLNFEPGRQNRSARRLARWTAEAWPRMADEAQLENLLECGLLLGVGIAQPVWETDGDGWVPRLRVWHPSFIGWRWDTRSYWLTTADGPVEVPEDGGGRWLVFCPYGYYRGWRRGLVRPLALLWLMRTWAMRDWARYSEAHGLPGKKAIVPPTADVDEKTRFCRQLANMGSEPVIECEQGDEGNRYDYQLVEAQADNSQVFNRLLAYVDTCIAVTVLGQNLTTEVKQGSRAAATVHENVRRDLLRRDGTTLGRALQRYVLVPWAEHNFGLGEMAPVPTWDIEAPQDDLLAAQAAQALGTAMVAFRDAGAPVDLMELLARFSLPRMAEGAAGTAPEPPKAGREQPKAA